MSPILGIWASSQQPALATSYESIATVTVGSGGSSTITFSSIPSTYKHLQIRTNVLSGATYSQIQFNSDTGANYSYHQLTGDGSGVAASGGGSVNQIYFQQMQGSTTYANVGIADILDYQNTNKNKTVRTISGYDNNTQGEIYVRSGAWFNTNAITTITITAQAGTGTFSQYSQFALYGVKG